MKGVKVKNLIKTLSSLSPKEQKEWVEKETKKVIKRLPTLKKRLTTYDDRSSELYNLTKEEIKLMSKVHISNGIGSAGYEEYVAQLEYYGETKIKELAQSITEQRINSFLENIKQVGGQQEYEYVKDLIDKMSKREKENFVKSKYFFDRGDLNSADFVKFIEENDVSVGTAKLESFLNTKRKEKFDGKYYKQGETRQKLGRPRKKGRKKK